MCRRILLRSGLLVLLLIVLPGVVLAGGVVVSLDGESPPAQIEAGVSFQIGFKVISMHGDGPMAGLEPLVIASHPASGERVEVVAKEVDHVGGRPFAVACAGCNRLSAPVRKGDPGHYLATLTLPTAGEWSWWIQPYGAREPEYPPHQMVALKVGAPGSARQSAVQTSSDRVAQKSDTLAQWVIPVAVAAVVITLLATILFRRRRPQPQV